MIGKTFGHYQITSQIGKGGMGEVYRARDTKLNRDIALKVLPVEFTNDAERMSRFKREAQLLASLNHTNIAAIYGLDESGGVNALVMELAEGPTLADRISKDPIPLDEALPIARQIAEALEAAHEKGIIHRDLKPANIKVTPEGVVKVLDFGLAKALEGEAALANASQSPTLSLVSTKAGVILGTAAYMAPEQARGAAVDKRSDIWSFGVVLFEMLAGKQLFAGATVSDTLAAVLKEAPDWNRVPAKIRPLLHRCLEKDPKKRLRDIGEAMAWIENSPERISEHAPAKHPWLWQSIAAALAVAFIAIVFVHFRGKPFIQNNQIRFQIALPKDVSLALGTPFALSPDGRRLAFWAGGSDRLSSLWIHALDSLESQSIQGTEASRGSPIYWSPDSRFVAYDAGGGKLKKMNVEHLGPAVEICNLSGYAIGGSWNQDDVIIFGDYNASNTIMRVPASEGIPSPVTRLNPQYGDISHIFPVFLPDGRHFLYFRRSSIPTVEGLFLGSLDVKPEEQEPKRLLDASSGAAYVPSQDSGSGQLLFLRGQTLMAQPFNHKRLELMGDAAPVVQNVGYYGALPDFTASTNGILIYRNGHLDQLSQPTWFDRQGAFKGTLGDVGFYQGISLLPDGTQALMSYQNHLQPLSRLDVWLRDIHGLKTRVTMGQGENVTPIWSPDSLRIIFSSSRTGMMDLYEKSASGRMEEEKLLLKSKEDKKPTSISKDGRFLLFTANDPKTKYDLWALSMEKDGRPKALLHAPFSESDGRFSPDMRWIAYVSDETGNPEIYVGEIRQIPERRELKIVDARPISQGGGTAPHWRRDGKELYYQSPDGKIMFVDVIAGPGFRAGPPEVLFTPALDPLSGSRFANWDVTADGSRFLMTTSAKENPSFTVIHNWSSLIQK
jgi:eukaryotic-like serine/threonine-protein kinase